MMMPGFLCHSRARHMGLAAILLIPLVLLLIAGRPAADKAARTPESSLPQPVIDTLTARPVWCYAEFSDGRLESVMIGYYPEPLNDLFERYGYDYRADMIAKQVLRCYTSWQAAFAHESLQPDGQHSQAIEQLREEMPAIPNEADYEIALLYSLFGWEWTNYIDARYSPPVAPQSWKLTKGRETILTPNQ